MRRTGLRARDLRILDPMLSYPSTVLGRRRAIVVNLEHIKAIVTATEVLVLSSKNPQVTAFVENLQYHVSNHHRTPRQAAESSDIDMGVTNKGPSPSFVSHDESDSPSPENEISLERSTMIPEMKDRSPDSTLDVPKGAGAKVLPFEFMVLEVSLQCACKCLESETSLLEKEAYPALDELTSKISTLNLERVRQIKSCLVTTSVRVQKMKDELEHLLDDDVDMAEMCLTDNLVGLQFEETSMSELDDEALDAEDERQVRDQLEHLLDNDVVMAEMYLTDKLVRQRLEETSSVSKLDDGALGVEDEIYEDSKSKDKRSYESLGSSKRSKPNIEELEVLLEACFTQIEGTRSKLSTACHSPLFLIQGGSLFNSLLDLREYVDDTEDYIDLMLHDKQNQLLQMGVMLTTAIFMLTVGLIFIEVLSIRINIELFTHGTQTQFLEATFGIAAGCLILYITVIGLLKKTGLLA